MKTQKSLADYADAVALATSGKFVFSCPNYAIVDAPGSMGIIFPIELPGPTQPNWRRQCAKILRTYQTGGVE